MQLSAFAIEWFGVVLPSLFTAAVMLVLLVCAGRFLSRSRCGDESANPDSARRAVNEWFDARLLSFSLVAAFAVGVLRIQDELSFPNRYWQWLPYVGMMFALVFPWKNHRPRRSAMSLLAVTVLAAWLLVPDWSGLRPSRGLWIPMLAAYLAGLVVTYGTAAHRIRVNESLTLLLLTSVILSAATAIIVSLKYADLGWVLVASMAGCLAITWSWRFEQAAIRGLMPCIAAILGGIAFVGCIYPQKPVYELMLVPYAPLGILWSNRVSQRPGMRAFALRSVPTLTLLGGICMLMLLRY